MFYALITAWCWSMGGFGSSRTSKAWGAVRANLARLVIAAVVLAVAATWAGRFPGRAGWGWFGLAGLAHLTAGDMALYGAYRRLGPRLGVLLVCSLSPVVALVLEWLSMGTTIRWNHGLWGVLILIAVGIAVAPREHPHLPLRAVVVGVSLGLFASVAQAVGAVANRYGYQVLADTGPSPVGVAAIRVATGAVGVGLWLGLLTVTGRGAPARPPDFHPHPRVRGPVWVWLAASTLGGPLLGMVALMKAFETAPSGLVLAVLATLPVFMVPWAWALDGEPLRPRSLLAGAAAVAFTILLIRT